MAASNLFVSWTGCAFTPSGGSSTPINKVTDCKPKRSGTVERFKADIDSFYRLLAMPTQERQIEITTGDVHAAQTFAVGAVGSLVITLADAVNGIATSGGGYTITLNPCMLIDNPAEGSHAKFASASLTFEGYAVGTTGSQTDPLSITAL